MGKRQAAIGWFLDQDESCHWYRIPAQRRAEWDAWRDLDSDDEKSWEPPAWAVMVSGHPNRIEFENPKDTV